MLLRSAFRLYGYRPEPVTALNFRGGLLAGTEVERFGELYRDAAKERVNVLDAADADRAGEADHPRVETRHAEVRDQLPAGMRTINVRITGKCAAGAGYIEHLTLLERPSEVLREAYRPVVMKAALRPLFFCSFHCDYPVNLKVCVYIDSPTTITLKCEDKRLGLVRYSYTAAIRSYKSQAIC
jgi:hypothetical protein